MGMAERIKERRIAMGYTQEELGDKLGLQKSAIAKYENGRVENIKRSVISNMATVLECSPSYLMGWTDNVSSGAHKTVINVLGHVAAGIPIEAITDIVDTEEISEQLARCGEYFGLRIKGDSMEPGIKNGDTIIVRQQPDAESGEVVVAIVNGNDGVCKRLRKYGHTLVLESDNHAYEPMSYDPQEVEDIPVRIAGKVVELRRKL